MVCAREGGMIGVVGMVSVTLAQDVEIPLQGALTDGSGAPLTGVHR